jgi:uncharacterized protein
MTTFDRMQQMRSRILETAARHGVTDVRVFGSVARREDRADSDIDLLVVVGGQASSWFPAGLVLDLGALLGRPVEVVTEPGLNPRLRERVLREAVAL